MARRLTERLDSVIDTPEGRQRVAEYLQSTPFPHFEAAPGRPGTLIMIQEDGTRTVGRFVNRKFTAVADSAVS